MTPEEQFIFDVQGYIVIRSVLGPEQIARMLASISEHGIKHAENDPTKSRFGGFFGWSDDFRGLIDHPRILPLLGGLIGPKFRLDHAYGMAMSASGARGGEGLHHEAAMFDHGCYYVTHRERMHNGLIVVSFALCDAGPGDGGFCCIPGSHKALYPVPKDWYGVYDNPMIQQPAVKAGDVIIFTESLTHGTMPWTNTHHERRSVLLKYCPHYMQWSRGPLECDLPGLSLRQKQIMAGAYVWDRPAISKE